MRKTGVRDPRETGSCVRFDQCRWGACITIMKLVRCNINRRCEVRDTARSLTLWADLGAICSRSTRITISAGTSEITIGPSKSHSSPLVF